MIADLLVLASFLIQIITYDVYAYYKPVVPGVIIQTSLFRQCFSDDQMYLAIAGSGTEDPIQVYMKNSTGFDSAYTVQTPDTSGVAVSSCTIYGSTSVLLLVQNTDFNVRVYKLNQTGAVYYQTVSYHTSLLIIGSNQDYIILSEDLNVTVLWWDSPNNQYNAIHSTSTTITGNQKARAISPDGLYYIQDQYGGTTMMELYMQNTGTYTMVNTFDLSLAGSAVISQISQVRIYQDATGSYYVVLAYISRGAYGHIYLTISGTAISLHLFSSTLSTAFTAISLSANGSHVLGISSIHTAQLYSYDHLSDTFNLLFSNNLYQNALVPESMYVYYGDFFAVGYLTTGVSTNLPYLGYAYFQCTVANCLTCSFMGVCKTCTSGFILSNNICSCPTMMSISGSVCISCNISLCAQCITADVCLSCSNGFTLEGNSCVCSASQSVSLVSGLCVSCSFSVCSRCDYDGICSSTGSSTTETNSMTMAILALIILILLLVIIGFAYLVIKLHHLQTKNTQVTDTNPQSQKVEPKQDNELNKTNFKLNNNAHSEIKIRDLHLFQTSQNHQVFPQFSRRKNRKSVPLEDRFELQIRPGSVQSIDEEF